MASRSSVYPQRELENLSRELFEDAFSRRISRREALSDVVRVAGVAALSFVAGGLIGYLFAPRREEVITKTITKTTYKTETKTVTQTITSIKTVTETYTTTYTTTKTERPEINIQVQVGKSYNATAKDYEIGLKVVSPELDSLRAYYENASIKGVIDKWERKTNAYYSSFLTQREIGEQRIRLEVEKDGARASKEFSLNVGLSEEEISQSPLDRNALKVLWRDLLEDSELNLDREELLREEYRIVKDVNLKQVEKPISLYLKQLSAYLISNQQSHENVLKGLSLLLPLLPSKPWIYNGNFVEAVERAEFPITMEASYSLAKFLSEMDIGKEYVYAARAMVDQMLATANWLRIDPFEVLEYEDRKLQLWDLTKQLFQKHIEFEARGKRASMSDEVLIKRWSDRSEANNNRHIYYGLRQVQLPQSLFFVTINRRYAWEDYPYFLGGSQPNGLALPNFTVINPEQAVKVFSEWVENYESLNDELNKILKDPEQCIYPYEIKGKKYCWNVPNYLRMLLDPERGWNKRYFFNTAKEANQDDLKLYVKGSYESRNSIILYIYSILTMNTPKGLEEVRVDKASCDGSLTGYPIYREWFAYPKRRGLHGEPSFILNEEDESLLYKRSSKELLIEPDTYSLNILFTRRYAVEKDGSRNGFIILPTIERKCFYEMAS